MRTKTLKINGQEKEAMLMAGGYGAKVYAVGADLVLTVGKKNFIIEESNPAYKITMKFVNLKYQPISEHEYIKLSFQELVSGLSKQKNPREPEFLFGREGLNDWQHSYLGSDKDIYKIGQYRSGHAYTFLPHRIKYFIETHGTPDFIHVISNSKSRALKAVYAEKGTTLYQLWSYVDIRQEPGWKLFEKEAHALGYKIKHFNRGKFKESKGYWLEGPVSMRRRNPRISQKWLDFGTKVEMEHTSSRAQARKIALDHLRESPNYYKDWKRKEKMLFKAKANPMSDFLYKWLEKNHIMWGRNSDGTLWVRTSGYKTHHEDGHYGVEKIMRKHGYFMSSEDFDRVVGQTVAIYKEKISKNPRQTYPIYAKGVPKLPKGFSGEWEQEDYLDAIDAYNRTANMFMEKGIEGAVYQKSVVIEPSKIIAKGMDKLLGKKGFLKSVSKAKWLEKLPNKIISNDKKRFQRIIGLWEDDNLPSVIVIDDVLYDGYHRVAMAHALGQKVVAAIFKTRK